MLFLHSKCCPELRYPHILHSGERRLHLYGPTPGHAQISAISSDTIFPEQTSTSIVAFLTRNLLTKPLEQMRRKSYNSLLRI